MNATTKAKTPRVFIACLTCYNAGRTHGQWIDADDADEMQMCIDAYQKGLENKQLYAATTPCGHTDNDWYIQDHAGFCTFNIGENPSLLTLQISPGTSKNTVKHSRFTSTSRGRSGTT